MHYLLRGGDESEKKSFKIENHQAHTSVVCFINDVVVVDGPER